jgi:hypothetical protein
MSYPNRTQSVIHDISYSLLSSSKDYLRIGMQAFQNSQLSSWKAFQPVIGNLCISLELLLKFIVAKHSLRDLYKNLPLEAKIVLSCPESFPSAKAANKYFNDLKNFDYKTIEFDEAVSIFYILFPENKQFFRPYFSFISKVRNISVHASIPQFQVYELHRIVYALLSLFNKMIESNVIGKNSLSDDDKKYFVFIKRFNEERTSTVKKKIESAREKFRNLEPRGVLYSFLDEWEFFVTHCPICDSDGILEGYTECETEESETESFQSLWFMADSFECEYCGLNLIDSSELELAGMELTYDRNDELDSWLEENSIST